MRYEGKLAVSAICGPCLDKSHPRLSIAVETSFGSTHPNFWKYLGALRILTC